MATLRLAARPRALHCRCAAAEPPPLPRRAALSAAALLALRPALPAFAAAPALPSPALLHAVLRVKNLDAATAFAVGALGMKVLRSRPGNVFVGFGSESRGKNFSLELEPTDDGQSSAPGDDFAGLVLAVDNPSKAAAKAAAAGARRASGGLRCSGDAITGCVVSGESDDLPIPVAFVKAGRGAPPVARVVLLVASLPTAVAFYTNALGMKQLASQAGVSDRAAEDPAPPARALLAFSDGAVAVELRQLQGGPSRAAGSAAVSVFDKVAIAVPDLAAAASRVEAAGGGGALLKQPFAVPGIGTRVAIARDPDGHVLALVDAADFEKELL
jgi:catechol 2,3-dioxygenase-like lactoylglutathione lyase family enzyme